MKKEIIRYNAANARMDKGTCRTYPTISMQLKGVFRFNRTLMDALKTEVGDSVEFLHDTTEGQWYVSKSKGGGLTLRKGANGGATFTSVLLHSAIVESMDEDDRVYSGRFRVAALPTTVDGSEAFAVFTGERGPEASPKTD